MAGQPLPEQQDDRPQINSAPAGGSDDFSRCGAFAEKEPHTGFCRVQIAVGGVHCAGCIRKIEAALQADPAVRRARLNFSTHRLAVAWEGEPEYAEIIALKVAGLGYEVRPYDPREVSAEEDRESRFLLLCLGVAGFAAGNIMLLSFALWSTPGDVMGVGMRDFLHWISALIAMPAIAFSGRPFFFSAWRALKNGRTNMDVPISVAFVLTVAMSLFELFRHGEHAYFDSAVMLMFFLLLGRTLDARARKSARAAADGLLSMMAATATVLEEGRARIVPARDLREGMIVLAGMGERIPADGVIVAGRSEIDASLVTGESLPQPAAEGAVVYSGTMNIAAPLTIRVSRAAEASLLAEIVKLMEKAEQGQARYVRMADRAARLYTPVVHALAILSFAGWILAGGLAWQQALLIAATVLIITCPCALGLAVPVVQVLAVGRLMRSRILVKSGDALERLAAVDTVVFDKTGTLTLGRPVLDMARPYDPGTMKLAASLAARSRHPLARALAASWQGGLFDLPVKEYPGQGLEAVFEGKTVRLGSRAWCGDGAAPHFPEKLELWLDKGEGAQPAPFYFMDRLRPDARRVVDSLRRKGLTLYLLSGDRAESVAHAAQALGIENARGEMKPEEKFSWIGALHEDGRKILMIGDGLNDAPVLAAADASISPASAIDIAQNAADIVFMGDSLSPVLDVLETARLSQKLVKQNFALATLYNAVAIPLAMLGYVTPLIAAIAMSGSSLVVIANSFRLRLRPRGNKEKK